MRSKQTVNTITSIKKRHRLTIENDIKKLNENIELQILSILSIKSLKLYLAICLLNIVLKFNFLRLIPSEILKIIQVHQPKNLLNQDIKRN